MVPINEYEEFVRADYTNKDAMHGWAHILRLISLAESIAEGKILDLNVLVLGAYFHGVIYRREPEIRDFLRSKHMSPEIIDRIIRVSWESGNDSTPETVEGAILHDAHLLEGGKTFIITKSFVTGTSRGQSLEETIRFIEEHILGKFKCYYPESQVMYDEKEQFARMFLDDMKSNL